MLTVTIFKSDTQTLSKHSCSGRKSSKISFAEKRLGTHASNSVMKDMRALNHRVECVACQCRFYIASVFGLVSVYLRRMRDLLSICSESLILAFHSFACNRKPGNTASW